MARHDSIFLQAVFIRSCFRPTHEEEADHRSSLESLPLAGLWTTVFRGEKLQSLWLGCKLLLWGWWWWMFSKQSVSHVSSSLSPIFLGCVKQFLSSWLTSREIRQLSLIISCHEPLFYYTGRVSAHVLLFMFYACNQIAFSLSTWEDQELRSLEKVNSGEELVGYIENKKNILKVNNTQLQRISQLSQKSEGVGKTVG